VHSDPLSSCVKLAFHDVDTDTDTDTDILATILARMSVSASWNASLTACVDAGRRQGGCKAVAARGSRQTGRRLSARPVGSDRRDREPQTAAAGRREDRMGKERRLLPVDAPAARTAAARRADARRVAAHLADEEPDPAGSTHRRQRRHDPPRQQRRLAAALSGRSAVVVAQISVISSARNGLQLIAPDTTQLDRRVFVTFGLRR